MSRKKRRKKYCSCITFVSWNRLLIFVEEFFLLNRIWPHLHNITCTVEPWHYITKIYKYQAASYVHSFCFVRICIFIAFKRIFNLFYTPIKCVQPNGHFGVDDQHMYTWSESVSLHAKQNMEPVMKVFFELLQKA